MLLMGFPGYGVSGLMFMRISGILETYVVVVAKSGVGKLSRIVEALASRCVRFSTNKKSE